ncbi:MAG TPA: ABC transporter ATP-binding protein [Candidatus Dormibacteraeota bacterium]
MSSPNGGAALLSVRGLHTQVRNQRRTTTVVDRATFDIGRREVLALIGESGSGKTMTALSILRLVSPPISIAGGEVWYQGQNLVRLPEDAMRSLRGRQIAMIFQNPRDRFDPLQTIGDQLVEVLLHHRVARGRREAEDRAVDLLAEVQLLDGGRVMRLYPNEVSGGMLQRAMIALAIAPAPDLLIADEPTSALDVTIQSEILDLLKDLEAARSMSILFITHDISVARQVADTVAVMYAGQLVEYGAAAEVFANPRHPYTQALLASVPSPDAEILHPIPGQPPALSNPPPGCRFAPRCPSAAQHGRALEPPPVVTVDRVSVRCWLYDPGGA